MTYPEFTKKFKLQSERLSYERKIHFAIIICKKLYIDYLKFYQENEWGDPDLLLDTIAFIEKLRNSHPDSSIINERLHSIEAITPDTEDFEDASYALNACVAVYEALEFLIDRKPEHIYNIGTCLTDTIDSLIQEESSLEESEIDINPLMIETREFLLAMTQ
ncbi:DUF416 family protein [Spirosoma fluminis]